MDPLTLLAAAVAALAGIVVLERLIVETRMGVRWVVIGTCLHITLNQRSAFDVGPIAVEFRDVIFGALFLAGIARLLRSDKIRDGQGLTIIVIAVMLFSLARGIQVHDLQTAVNEARKYIHFLGGVLYLAPITLEDADLREFFARWWVGFGCWLAGVAVFRWVAQGFGLVGGIFGDKTDLRTVAAASALVIAQAALIGVIAGRDAPRWIQQATPVLFVVTLLVQHRTVWIVMIVSMTMLIMRNRTVTRRLGAAMAGMAVVGILLVMTVFAGSNVELADDLSDSGSNATTFEWRVEGWRALLVKEGRGLEDYVLGEPYGTGWERHIFGQVWTASPHSFYVESQLRLGLIGVAALTLMHVLPIRRLGRHGWKYESLSTETLQVLSVTLLVYYLTYAPNAEQSMMLGMIMAAGWTPEAGRATVRRRRRPSRSQALV